MEIVQVAQSLIPQLDLTRAINDRERNLDLSKFLANDQLDHLEPSHQFRVLKKSTKTQGQNFAPRNLVSSILTFFKYFTKNFSVFLWVFRVRKKLKESPKQETVIIKGLGFQHLNSHFSIDEIVDSIPHQVLQTEEKEECVFTLISLFSVPTSHRALTTNNIFQALLMSQKPSVSGLLRYIYQVNIFGLLALVNSKIRKMLGEIPSALLLSNFETKTKYLSLIDTQGSFENLDLMYYIKNLPKHIKSTMIHYSEGGMPFTKNQLVKSPFVRNYELAPVNRHIVWTAEYSEFYNSKTLRKNFMPLGPQIFRSSSFTKKYREPFTFNLAVFDETPSLLDESYEHMREDAGIRFLLAIESLSKNIILEKEKQLKITFKQKRRNLESHSKLYLEKLDILCDDGVIELLPWFANPFEMIGNSDSVLTVIGSSPALIAQYLDVPTAYGYFGNQELGEPIVNYNIPVLRSDNELVDWVMMAASTGE
jgi:polysaccharide biosynthesis PFTS motif protein